MAEIRYSLFVDSALLIDGSLPEEKKSRARELADKIFGCLSDTFRQDFGREGVIMRREIEYAAEALPALSATTLAGLTPPEGEGKRRCVLLIFHGEDGSVAEDTVTEILSLLKRNGLWLGRTRVFVFSEEDELVKQINDVCYMGLWGVPRSELHESVAEDVSDMIYH